MIQLSLPPLALEPQLFLLAHVFGDEVRQTGRLLRLFLFAPLFGF